MSDTATSNRDLILAAVSLAGPVPEDEAGVPDKEAWNDKVRAHALDLFGLTSEYSPLSKLLNTLQGPNTKKFVGVLEGVLKENSTTRAFVAMRTQVSKYAQDGIEVARTERTDAGPEHVEFARKLVGLRGHRLLFWVEMQETAEGQKVRVLRHVEDLGLADDWDEEKGKAIVQSKLNK